MNSVQSLLAIAENHLQGEMAAKRGRTDDAVAHLEKAIVREDELTYDEPPPWYLPICQRLGRVLLEAERAAEAEKAFRADLVRRPGERLVVAMGWHKVSGPRSGTRKRPR